MKISVVLCAYNASRYIREAMDSIIAQKYENWEAICIDDGSTDDSGRILEEYAAKDGRIKVYHQANRGLAASRNRGVALAEGDYITFCDADDLLATHWFANAVTLIERTHPDLLRAHLEFGTEPPVCFYEERQPEIESCQSTEKDCRLWAWSKFFKYGFVVTTFINKDLKPHIRFPEDFVVKEDSMMLLNLAPHLRSVAQSNCCGYFYRNSAASMLRKQRVSLASVRYLDALADLWAKEKEKVGELGLTDELRTRLQQFADNDVIDWAIDSADESRVQKLQVLEAWRRLRGLGAFDGRFHNRFFFYLPFQWWKMTGGEFPIKLTWKLFLLVRKALLRK